MGFISKVRAMRGRTKAAVAAVAIVCALFGVSQTGAYFSDSHNGAITGTVGSICINPSGGAGSDSMDFAFSNLLPGEPQTVTLNYANCGTGNQDVYLKFPNATALSALNNLGTYGEVHVVSNGTEIFGSNNLNDNTTTCPSGCNPLPNKLKLADNLAPGAGGNVKFTFAYAGKLKTQPPAGTTAAWNTYPVPGQFTVNAADGTGNGLPWQLVAVQVNQQP